MTSFPPLFRFLIAHFWVSASSHSTALYCILGFKWNDIVNCFIFLVTILWPAWRLSSDLLGEFSFKLYDQAKIKHLIGRGRCIIILYSRLIWNSRIHNFFNFSFLSKKVITRIFIVYFYRADIKFWSSAGFGGFGVRSNPLKPPPPPWLRACKRSKCEFIQRIIW